MHPSLSFSLRDEFSRKPIADKLIHLLTSDIELSPIIINGDWGTGKTEFCHKVIHEIKENHDNLKCVYVDAFNADSSDEPILTLIAAIISLFPEQEDKKSIIKKAIPVLKYASKVLLNAGTTIILKESVDNLGEELSEALKEQTTTAIDTSIDNLLNIHEKSNENILALRRILESLSNEHPIIIFIDELDRCRPNYALKMIESIKHIFSINNVKFVMISNLKQLESSINKVYGDSIDANKYLDKFIGFKVDLSEYHNNYNFEQKYNSEEYFSLLIRKNEKLKIFHSDVYLVFICFLIKKYKLSLRDIEKLVRTLDIYQNVGEKITENSVILFSIYKIIGIFIYLFHINFKEKITNDNYNCEDVLDFFGFHIINNENIIKDGKDYVSEIIIIKFLISAKNINTFKNEYPILIKNLNDHWESYKQPFLARHFHDDNDKIIIVKKTIHALMLF